MRLLIALVVWLVDRVPARRAPPMRTGRAYIEERWDWAYVLGPEQQDRILSLYGPDPRVAKTPETPAVEPESLNPHAPQPHWYVPRED